MTLEEATVLVGRMRGTWPSMYLVDDGLDVWVDYFLEQDFDTAVIALHTLSRTLGKPPALRDFVELIEGERKRRFKCPVCDLGFPTQERMVEHLEIIHRKTLAETGAAA